MAVFRWASTPDAEAAHAEAAASADPRDVVRAGLPVAGGFNTSEYYNQPQSVQLSNGSWLLVLTNAGHSEGQVNQRVVSRLHQDPDLTNANLARWMPDVDIENNAFGPSAGWAVPLYAPALDRIYAVYTFNAGNITTMPDGTPCRCQLVGGQFMRWSDDSGATWSRERLPVHVRVTSIDKQNPWNGTVLQGWTVSKPITLENGTVLMPFTKIGTYIQSHDRQWVLRSDNILTEPDPARVIWRTLPEGNGGATQGCAAADGSDEAEEGGMLLLGGQDVLYIFRTSGGFVNECLSRDGGLTWTPRLAYYKTGRPLKNPRGPITARRLRNGTFLLLFFNNGWKGYSPASNNTRNPYFLVAGRRVKNETWVGVEWSQPEVALYGRGWDDVAPAPAINLAYPDIVEQRAEEGGDIVIFEAHEVLPGQNCREQHFESLGGCGLATHVVQPELIAGMTSQLTPHDLGGTRHAQITPAAVEWARALSPKSTAYASVVAPTFPNLNAAPGGMTIELWVSNNHSDPVLLDCRRNASSGLVVRRSAAGDGSVELVMASLQNNSSGGGPIPTVTFSSDAGVLNRAGDGPTQVAVIVDGGPQLVSWVVDGEFGDGGDGRVFGYSFFRRVGNVNNAQRQCRVSSAVIKLRMYTRYLRVAELVANFHAERRFSDTNPPRAHCIWNSSDSDPACASESETWEYPACALFQRNDRSPIPCQGRVGEDFCAFTPPSRPPPTPASWHVHVFYPNPSCPNCTQDLSHERPGFTKAGAMALRRAMAQQLNVMAANLTTRPLLLDSIDVQRAFDDPAYENCIGTYNIIAGAPANFMPTPCIYECDGTKVNGPFTNPNSGLGYPNFSFFIPGKTWAPGLLEQFKAWVMLNRGLYDVLIHPNSGCETRDHAEARSIEWMGNPHALSTDVFSCNALGCNQACRAGASRAPPANCSSGV